MKPLRLGISPCPNDTYIYGGWILNLLQNAPAVEHQFHDVQQLNQLAKQQQLDIAKISIGALPGLIDEWELLDCGGAMGRGCGPLLLESPRYDGAEQLCWLPGEQTTAARLYRWWCQLRSRPYDVGYERFDRIYNKLMAGEIGKGVAIHEGRFTYQTDGLSKIVDLGEEWEKETGLPIPLGGVVLRKSLIEQNPQLKTEVERAIRDSIFYAQKNLDKLMPWIVQCAGIPSQSVIQSHIGTYVTPFSLELGEEGRDAIQQFLQIASKSSN